MILKIKKTGSKVFDNDNLSKDEQSIKIKSFETCEKIIERILEIENIRSKMLSITINKEMQRFSISIAHGKDVFQFKGMISGDSIRIKSMDIKPISSIKEIDITFMDAC